MQCRTVLIRWWSCKQRLHILLTMSLCSQKHDLTLGSWALAGQNAQQADTPLQEHSPVLGHAGSRDRTNQPGKRSTAHKRGWLSRVTASSILSWVTRVLRLLYNITDTVISKQVNLQQHAQYGSSVLLDADSSPSERCPPTAGSLLWTATSA